MNTETVHSKVLFPGVKDGEIFTIAGMEFIKFPKTDVGIPVVMKSAAYQSRFGGNNDFRSSDVLKEMVADILPKIVEVVGDENICTFNTDLTTLDGLKPYGELESRISLPTLDFYRANVEIFDRYKLNDWWWLATPESAKPHYDPTWFLCVSPSGRIGLSHYYYDNGVRPFLILKSSIFGSSEA